MGSIFQRGLFVDRGCRCAGILGLDRTCAIWPLVQCNLATSATRAPAQSGRPCNMATRAIWPSVQYGHLRARILRLDCAKQLADPRLLLDHPPLVRAVPAGVRIYF